MEIRFLGTANGFISASRWQTSILVRDEFTFLLDCGAPVAHLMARHKLKADSIDTIWLSHSHSDHIGQFPSLIQHLWLEKRSKPLRVVGPGLLLRGLREWLPMCMLFPELLPFKIEWHEISVISSPSVTFGSLTFTSFPTRHLYNFRKRFAAGNKQACFETLAVRVETPRCSFGFSADLDSPEDLTYLIKNPLNVLICEMTHFKPESLFEKMANTKVSKLILTHYPDKFTLKESKLQALAAKQGFAGEVVLATDEACFKI